MTTAHIVQDQDSRHLLSAAVAAIPKSMHGQAVVEIGSGVGGSAQLIAAALDRVGNPATLYCIDACVMPEGWVASRTKNRHRRQRDAILDAIAGLPLVRFIEARSTDARQDWAEPIAFLFIDGGHHYPEVVADLEWANLVLPGGLMAVHDFGSQLKEWGHDGVTRAVVEFLAMRQDWRWLACRGSMLILQRTS